MTVGKLVTGEIIIPAIRVKFDFARSSKYELKLLVFNQDPNSHCEFAELRKIAMRVKNLDPCFNIRIFFSNVSKSMNGITSFLNTKCLFDIKT